MANKRIKNPQGKAGKKIGAHGLPEPGSSGITGLQYPVFCFRYLSNTQYSFDKLTKEEKLSFIQRLVEIARFNWAKLYGMRKDQGGAEKVPCHRLNSMNPPDEFKHEEKLTVFRFARQECRIAGFSRKGIMHIVWLERDHSLYSHG